MDQFTFWRGIIIVAVLSLGLFACDEDTELTPEAYSVYKKHRAEPHYRAFAISRYTGKYPCGVFEHSGGGYKSAEEAVQRAIMVCGICRPSAEAKAKCKLYSVGDIVVYRMTEGEIKAAIRFYQRNPKATNDDFASRFITDTPIATLLDAAKIGDVFVVQKLLEQGIDVNARSDIGDTALMLGAFGGHTKAVKVLLAGGADVNAKSDAGTTALMYAEIRKKIGESSGQDVGDYLEIIRLLKQAGAEE